MKATIFHIQRFSVHDGPGIRTTVFFKGCPLSCPWCHNPEGLSGKRQLQFFKEKCTACGRCGDRQHLTDADRCPVGALQVCGEEIEEEALLPRLLRDRSFYRETGGVTFSGGECLLQAEFVSNMLSLLKKEKISTAIDTSGAVPWTAFEEVMDKCDLFLYDLKCMNAQRHLKYTGASNALILENLSRLSKSGAKIWIRVPVIPDFNDTVGEMEQIASFASGLDGVECVTLMPYHTLGVSKYPTLGISCRYQTEKSLSKEYLAELTRPFAVRGLQLN